MRRCLLILAISAFFLPLIVARQARADRPESLIQTLADPDPQKRAAAETELKQLGATARPALIDATRSPDPAIAAAATRILLVLPWQKSTDPDEVKVPLASYGTFDEAGREAVITRLAALPPNDGLPVLLRLVQEEPSEDVCWKIVSTLREHWDPKLEQQVRKLNPPQTRPAALLLTGLAWMDTDPQKASTYFKRAIEIETAHPTLDDGELDVAFSHLVAIALDGHAYDDAAQLRRQQALRAAETHGSPGAVYELFLMHAQYGPLAGFEQDIQSFGEYLGDPAVLYALSRTYGRAGRDIEAMAFEATARAAGLSAASHYRLARIFGTIGWNTFARDEAYAAVSSINGNDVEAFGMAITVRQFLGNLAAMDDNDKAAIEHFTAAQALMNQVPGVVWTRGDNIPFGPNDLDVQIAWRQARVARSSGDEAEAKRLLDKTMSLSPADQSDAALNVYPLLESAGRSTEAKDLFDKAYAEAREKLDQDPKDPVQMNDLAWLCARCDQRLPEALELAKKAVAAQPRDAAFIDTLAEIHFRLGHAEEAAKLEARALELRPGDEFMSRQIERFRAGIK